MNNSCDLKLKEIVANEISLQDEIYREIEVKKMSKLDELIDKLCPEGVSYKTIGELCSLVTKQTGFDYSNHIKDRLVREQIPNSVPYIQTKFFTGKNFDYNTDYYVPADVVQKFPKITLNSKCLLLSIVGASIGNVGLYPGDKTSFLGGAICVAKVKPEYNIDYIYYCLESNHVQHQIRRKTKGAGQATITVDDIRRFNIPFPPVSVQQEIVAILDRFDSLVSDIGKGIPAEIKARKEQYEYYRDKLLDFKNSPECKVEYRPLGEFCDILRGKRLTKSQLTEEGKYPVLHGGLSPMGYYNEYNRKENTTIVVNTGNAGSVYWSDKKFWSSDACFSLYPKSIVLDRFLYFFVASKEKILQSKTRAGAMPTIDSNVVSSLLVPIPPIEEQKRIVNILDKFTELTAELSAELTARRKQYEYYRDKLLTFKKLA